jgi:hypothetical protein
MLPRLQLTPGVLGSFAAETRFAINTLVRQRGGIEPLHVSMPLELKSSPSTSLTHPGLDDDLVCGRNNMCESNARRIRGLTTKSKWRIIGCAEVVSK